MLNNAIKVRVTNKLRLQIEEKANEMQIPIASLVRKCIIIAFRIDLTNDEVKVDALHHQSKKTLLEGNFHNCTQEKVIFKIGKYKLVKK
jgi:peptide subunit release factor 1 (eRF1)